jgi:hypothetical protein
VAGRSIIAAHVSAAFAALRVARPRGCDHFTVAGPADLCASMRGRGDEPPMSELQVEHWLAGE